MRTVDCYDLLTRDQREQIAEMMTVECFLSDLEVA